MNNLPVQNAIPGNQEEPSQRAQDNKTSTIPDEVTANKTNDQLMTPQVDEPSKTFDTNGEQNLPFVNEECGDTMWDKVLEEAEEKLQKMFTPQPGEVSSEKPARDNE